MLRKVGKLGCHVHACVDMLWFFRTSDMPTTSVGMAPYFPQQQLGMKGEHGRGKAEGRKVKPVPEWVIPPLLRKPIFP
jgi:hypothetical protein